MEDLINCRSKKYMTNLVKFLDDYKYIFMVSNVEYLKEGVLKSIREWSNLEITNEELNRIPLFEYKVILLDTKNSNLFITILSGSLASFLEKLYYSR